MAAKKGAKKAKKSGKKTKTTKKAAKTAKKPAKRKAAKKPAKRAAAKKPAKRRRLGPQREDPGSGCQSCSEGPLRRPVCRRCWRCTAPTSSHGLDDGEE